MCWDFLILFDYLELKPTFLMIASEFRSVPAQAENHTWCSMNEMQPHGMKHGH